MNQCIIAVLEEGTYKSIVCQFEEDIVRTLQTCHNSFQAATALVALGDLSYIDRHKVDAFHRDWGFSWSYTKPKEFASIEQLLESSRLPGLDYMFLFKENQWRVIKLGEPIESIVMEEAA